MNNNFSFITNISFPKTIDEVLDFMYLNGRFNIEDIFDNEKVDWTSPKWAKKGTLVFFMHSKTSNQTISALKTELKNNTDKYDSEEYDDAMKALEHGKDLYLKYGGKIFAIGIVESDSFKDEELLDFETHWNSKIYSEIKILHLLDTPVDISEFNTFIKVSRTGAITNLDLSQTYRLIDIIERKNNIKIQ